MLSHVLVSFAIVTVSLQLGNNETGPMRYLERFGFLEKRNGVFPLLAVRRAILRFQKMYKLPLTGLIDENVEHLMKTPRCGVPDIRHRNASKRRQKRFSVTKYRWHKRTLTYRITKYGNQKYLTNKEIDETVKKAFEIWTHHVKLRFTQVGRYNGRADITIYFDSDFHGDLSPFDGQGGVLAHATYPVKGSLHFDDDEVFTIENRGNISGSVDLLLVAAHEVGHILGIDHSENERALMFAYYSGYTEGFSLPQDDVQGIVTLYGPGTDAPCKSGGKLLLSFLKSFPGVSKSYLCSRKLFHGCCT